MTRRPVIGAGCFISHAIQRHGPLRRSHDVRLTRFADERARFQLSQAAQLDLHPVVGDQLQCELEWRDGWVAISVVVYAVHPNGFVDVRGIEPLNDNDRPERARLRRWPENTNSNQMEAGK